jgi:hypothetical protein
MTKATFDLYTDVFWPFSENHIALQSKKADQVTLKDTRLGITYSTSTTELLGDLPISALTTYGSAGISVQTVAEFVLNMDHLLSGDFETAFSIGGIDVSVGPISATLWHTFQDQTYIANYRDSYDGSGLPLLSILLVGVNSTNCLDYLDKAVFKLGLSEEWSYDGERIFGWPEIGFREEDPIHFPEGPEEIDYGDGDFRHSEPLNFINAAMRARSSEERFILLFRVLEYFSTMAVLDLIKQTVKVSTPDEELYKQARKLLGFKEEAQIARLIGDVCTNDIYDLAVKSGIVTISDADALAKELYERRNSIAHGKRHRGPLALLPRFLGEESIDPEGQVMLLLCLKSIDRWSRC